MLGTRDIFTFKFLGREPSLKDLLLPLPASVSSGLLGQRINNKKDIDICIAGLTDHRKLEIYRNADLILHGGRMEKEALEDLARQNDIGFSKGDSQYLIVHLIFRKIGYDRLQSALTDILAPSEIETKGTFAEYKAPFIEISETKLIAWATELESLLESLLSKGSKDTRQVKVRLERTPDGSVIVGIYYQRPDVDGKDVQRVSKSRVKQVVQKVFKRSAGDTYFVIKPGKDRSRIMFKSPDRPLARSIRTALGQTIWKTTEAISETPITAYNLSVFKSPDFTLSLADVSGDIEKIALAEVNVRAVSGNLLRVKTDKRNGDALTDFRSISRGAHVLVEESEVESVLIKFLPKKDKRKVLAKAKLYPNKIEIDEQHWDLVNTHLAAWGVING
jgi:hypothetical protein